MAKRRLNFRVPPTARQRGLEWGELAGPAVELERKRHEAREHQRLRQQGLGNPIVSASFSGQRFVAVGNRLYHSRRWTTFHDFLIEYGREVLGTDWWLEQVRKAAEQRHPVVTWFERLAAPSGSTPGLAHPMTGGAAAYLRLAYDLYCLKHNTAVRDRLVQRVRDRGNFEGARYEVFVASAFIRAGFTIEFEDEDDPTTSHCEFTATHKSSGKRFSVEAKRCAGARPRIGRHLTGALRKSANHPRIVFIDLNAPDDGSSREPIPGFARRALAASRHFEASRAGQALPPAHVFFTNAPHPHHLDSTAFRSSVLAEGFRIPEFKGDAPFTSLRAAIDARDAHIEMEQLARSVRDHSDVPATFDGEVPEFAFGPPVARLRVGDRYLVPDGGGGLLVPGQLESAVVVEVEQAAYGAYLLDDGRHVTVSVPLTDAELAAYRQHPQTFFGVVERSGGQVANPVELYDFIYATYSQSPREKLLEFLAGAPDIGQLQGLTQPELARIYAERCVLATFTRAGAPPPPSPGRPRGAGAVVDPAACQPPDPQE